MSAGLLNENQQPITTYEVDIPSDQTDRLVVFEGLVKAFEWETREVARQQNTEKIVSDADIGAVSLEMFGVSRYGSTAASIVHEDASRLRFMIEERNGEIRFGDGFYNPRRGLTDSFLAPLGARRHEIIQAATNVLELQAFPVNFGFTPATNEYDFEKNILTVVPLETTKERLGRFLVHKGLSEHNLHGLLGKSLDVLNAVAGTAEPRSLEAYVSEDFVNLSRLFKLAGDSGLSSTSIQSIRSRIMWALADQIHTGKPNGNYGGEVVIEEEYDATKWHSSQLGSQSVALTSLVYLGETARKTAKYAHFLKNINEILSEQSGI